MLSLTDEEMQELERTLVGRIDLDIIVQLEEAMREGKLERVIRLNHMKEVNQSILNKLSQIQHTSPFQMRF